MSGLAPWALRATSGLPHISAGQQTALHKVLIQPFHRYLLSEAGERPLRGQWDHSQANGQG